MAVRHQTAKDCPRQHVRERRDQQRSFREAAECLCNDCQDSAKGNPAEKQPHEPSAATANALERLAEAIVAQADSFSAFISASHAARWTACHGVRSHLGVRVLGRLEPWPVLTLRNYLAAGVCLA